MQQGVYRCKVTNTAMTEEIPIKRHLTRCSSSTKMHMKGAQRICSHMDGCGDSALLLRRWSQVLHIKFQHCNLSYVLISFPIIYIRYVCIEKERKRAKWNSFSHWLVWHLALIAMLNDLVSSKQTHTQQQILAS